MITGKNYRITVLTDYLIRLEYNEKGAFVDQPTQTVVCRDFAPVDYEERDEDGRLIIETKKLLLTYDRKEFSGLGLSIRLKDMDTVWHYSIIYGNSDENLWGTGRTLDEADGSIPLESGLFGKRGYAVLDDSDSAVLSGEEFTERENPGFDLYFFGYGKEFRKGLQDFFILCGKTPMVPRYALGNWWSRYYRYSEESYNELLDRMEEEQIPLSVAVIDMDWHVTEVDEKYGTGWTGYSWNKDLFPDYKRFLAGLKKRKLAATLNLHPADGIRAFEDQYEEIARALGIDPESEKAAEFDFTDTAFRKAYFDIVMHPYEDAGVDFWWIDWQQGTKKGKSSIDPLFLLNHYHFEDRKRDNNRPLIFSRYAGPGSHRYPVGFSGDTYTTWRSLKFQPFFTSTASNIGYGWWSHDIGGHMLGDKDEERLIRWIQLGVFSPVMRLHSSNSPFFNKEPWNVSEPYRSIMKRFLRFRHRLLPYLYTASYRAYDGGRMLIEPMYYSFPDVRDAYEVPGEYSFGDALIVGAITEKMNESLRMAKVNMYIPKGRFFDIFTGRIYDREQKRNIYRRTETIPVLLKAGGVVPLSMEDTANGTDNPEKLRLLIGGGASGSYEMYEDDGISCDYEKGKGVLTTFNLEYDADKKRTELTIMSAKGELSLIPESREYELVFYGLTVPSEVYLEEGGVKTPLKVRYESDTHRSFALVPKADVAKKQTIMLEGAGLAQNDRVREVFEIMDYCWCETLVKEKVYDAVRSMEPEVFTAWLSGTDFDETLKDALKELF